jgi:hypothetical protein
MKSRRIIPATTSRTPPLTESTPHHSQASSFVVPLISTEESSATIDPVPAVLFVTAVNGPDVNVLTCCKSTCSSGDDGSEGGELREFLSGIFDCESDEDCNLPSGCESVPTTHLLQKDMSVTKCTSVAIRLDNIAHLDILSYNVIVQLLLYNPQIFSGLFESFENVTARLEEVQGLLQKGMEGMSSEKMGRVLAVNVVESLYTIALQKFSVVDSNQLYRNCEIFCGFLDTLFMNFVGCENRKKHPDAILNVLHKRVFQAVDEKGILMFPTLSAAFDRLFLFNTTHTHNKHYNLELFIYGLKLKSVNVIMCFNSFLADKNIFLVNTPNILALCLPVHQQDRSPFVTQVECPLWWVVDEKLFQNTHGTDRVIYKLISVINSSLVDEEISYVKCDMEKWNENCHTLNNKTVFFNDANILLYEKQYV